MVRFDEVIPTAVGIIRNRVPTGSITLIRDLTGQVTAILHTSTGVDLSTLASELHAALGAYSAGQETVVSTIDQLIDPQEVTGSPDQIDLPDFPGVKLLDRLLTNQDWLRPPLSDVTQTPVVVAYSIKGGVGRSTALGMLSWHLARLGHRVLVCDLDLEAPGISSLLLSELPDYGLVDWLSEDMVGQGDAEFLREVIGVSAIERDAGRVEVVPAFGKKSQEYVSKLGRIFAPSMSASGAIEGLAERLERFLSQVRARLEPPDVILIDARSGLHDIGAAVVTRLNANVLAFARDDLQSWGAYQKLFNHLRHSQAVAWGMPDNDLRWRIKMVAAQLEPQDLAQRRWIRTSFEIWSDFYDASDGNQEAPQTFAPEDESAPHFPLFIPFDGQIRGLSLASEETRPSWTSVEAIFHDFLAGATRIALEQDSKKAG